MIRFKGGDTNTDFSKSSLCDNCRNSVVAEGDGFHNKVQFCRSLRKEIEFKVVKCNDFDDKSQTDIWDMKEIAWKFATDKKGKTIGFVNPSKWRILVNEGTIEDNEE